MSSKTTSGSRIRPRIIIHGGAGNITRTNLPQDSYNAYRSALLEILQASQALLGRPNARALDVAVHAVSMLEDNPLFNSGKGAVFTRAGTVELEASVMVSNGYKKRGVGCMLIKHVRNPIKLAREMLVRGEDSKGGGAQGHCQLSGEQLELLARDWGLEMCEPEYYFTKRRWDEHKKGLEREKQVSIQQHMDIGVDLLGKIEPEWASDDPSWDGHEYLPQGTVGAVVLDSFGTVCVATSTGGLTNKLPGRIGDTPTIGAGFWAEEWFEELLNQQESMFYRTQARDDPTTSESLTHPLQQLISTCLPSISSYRPIGQHIPNENEMKSHKAHSKRFVRHAVAMSGTGNGDSFLRTSAARTTAAISRFSLPNLPLAACVTQVAGQGGELQRSAGDRWGVTGEGEGGIIGIELIGEEGKVVWDLNCGGMFRTWVDDDGKEQVRVFREE